MVSSTRSARRWSLERLLVVLAVTLGGCSLVVTTSGLSGSDGGAPTTGSEAGEDVDAGDASAFTSCAADGAAAPLRAFNPLGDIPDATPPCNAGNVLVTDDKGAGLDRIYDGLFTNLAAKAVTSCIGVEFGAPLTSVTIRLRAVANACGRACAAAECGQGRSAVVFVGATRGALRTLGDIPADVAFRDFSVDVTPTDRVAVVCRSAASANKDDVEVDSIVAGCQR
jgi:hypothetical protein